MIRGEKDIAQCSIELKVKIEEIGKEMKREACTLVDEILREDKKRKNKRGIKTIFGDTEYIRAYYKDKEETCQEFCVSNL